MAVSKTTAKPETLNKKATAKKATARKLAEIVDQAASLKDEIAGLQQQLKEKQAQLQTYEAEYNPLIEKADKADEVVIPGIVSKAVAGAVANATQIDHEGIALHMMKTKANREILATLCTFTVKDVKAYLSPDLVGKYTTTVRGDRKRTVKYIKNVDA